MMFSCNDSSASVVARMLALYPFVAFGGAGDRLFLPIANPAQQPLIQSSETVYVPVDQAWAETPQFVPVGAVPHGYYLEAIPQQQDRSVSMSWAFAGAVLVGLGAYYAGRVATLGTGGNVPGAVLTHTFHSFSDNSLNTEKIK